MDKISALIALLSLLTFVTGNLRVTQIQVVFRHGDRMPKETDLYPNDIHNVSVYEPFGLGHLTNMGKMRVYRTGQFLKTRYQELLGSVYTPTTVHAVSTDTDRTKMSLQILLAGLFPPSEDLRWNPDLPWIPIPIHYVPNPLDITMKSYLCPQFQDAEDEIMQFPEVRAKLATYNGLLEFLTVKTGQDLTSLRQVYRTFNLLVTQKSMNLTMPAWCTDAVLQQIRELISFRYDIWSYTTKAKRLGGGPMVRKLIENMRLNRTDHNPRKIYLYSGQKRTISFFLQAQGILEPKIPSYGAAVITEKLEDERGKLYLRTLMWTGVTEKLITLQVHGCEDVCPIEEYLQLTQDVIPSDEELDCHWKRLSANELRKIFEQISSGA